MPGDFGTVMTQLSQDPSSQDATVANERLPTLLETVKLTKSYRTREGGSVFALAETSLTLTDGEFVSVVGPSGCGKSTLMKLIAGIIPSTAGEILYRGKRVAHAQRGVGVVFQSPVLLPWLTVLENVLLPIRVLGMDRAAARIRGHELLAMVGLEDFAGKYPSELSGGMQQRTSIVRGLIHDPGMLLMDEPFGALDALTRESINRELQRIWLANRKTVFFITHSILEAVFLSDRVLVMSSRPGKIIGEFKIPFPRPRDFDLTTTGEFGRYVGEIRHLLGAKVDA
jgi:NitT/TauT family transport system ATP-binding protein